VSVQIWVFSFSFFFYRAVLLSLPLSLSLPLPLPLPLPLSLCLFCLYLCLCPSSHNIGDEICCGSFQVSDPFYLVGENKESALNARAFKFTFDANKPLGPDDEVVIEMADKGIIPNLKATVKLNSLPISSTYFDLKPIKEGPKV